MVLVKRQGQYALVSKSNPKKVLKRFGSDKPTKKQVLKEERRVQFFKRRLVVVKRHRRKGKRIKRYVRKSPKKGRR